MATAPRQASLSSVPSNRDFSLSPELEPATVEESPGDVDIVSIELRDLVLQSDRAANSARGASPVCFGRVIALGQRLSHIPRRSAETILPRR